MKQNRTALQRHAQRAIVKSALFHWQSVTIVVLTLILNLFLPPPFTWWPWFAWPLLGAIGLAIVVYINLTDPESNANILVNLIQQEFDLTKLRHALLREQINTALDYQRRIELQIYQQHSPVKELLNSTAEQIRDWLRNIYQLGLYLDAYHANTILSNQLAALPQELAHLKEQRENESNPTLQQQLDSLIVSKNQHWQTLSQLDTRMKQARLQIEQSVTALATVYSQVQLIDVQSLDNYRTENLQANIREEVALLNELAENLIEVYKF